MTERTKAESKRVTGEGWDALNESWRQIEVDLLTHEVIASAYGWPTRRVAEQHGAYCAG